MNCRKTIVGRLRRFLSDLDNRVRGKQVRKQKGELQDWLRFIRREGHILRDYPWLLVQQAANQPDKTSLAQVAKSRVSTAIEMRPWFRWVNKQTEQSASIMTLVGHKSSVYSCSISEDCRRLVSAGWDGVRVWDFDSGEQIRSEPVIKTRASFVALMPNKVLVSEWEGRNRHGRLQLFEEDSWRHLSELPLLVNSGGSLAVSISGDRIAVGEGNEIAVCNLAGETAVRQLVEPSVSNYDAFSFLSFTVNDSLLLSTDRMGNVRGWDTKSWEKTFQFKSPVPDLRSADLSPDRAMVVLVRPDAVLCYDVNSQRLHAILEGHSGGIEGCRFSPDGSRIVTWGRDGLIRIWARPTDLHADQPLPDQFSDWTSKKSGYQQSRAGTSIVTACTFSPAGSEIVAIDTNSGGELLDGHTLNSIGKIKDLIVYPDLAVKGQVYTACAISPDGTTLVCGNKTGELRKYHLDGLSPYTVFPSPHSYAVNDIAFSPDGKSVLSVSEDRSFKLWDAATCDLHATVRAHDGSINGCCYSPQGDLFATASEDCTVKVWEPNESKPRMVLKHSTAVRSVAFSPNSAELATSTAAGTLCLWELTGETLSKEMRVCEQNARRCWWSPDASYLVVTCEPGGVVLLLDLKTGESKARFVSGKSLQASAMASDANRVFITTKPGAVFLLSLENRPPSIS